MKVEQIITKKIMEFDKTGRMFLNVNTPADYARALSLAAYHAL